MPPPAVDVENLSHHYGERAALAEVDLSVQEGALFGVLGPNGGGKTTLFRILATLIRPTKGTATVFGVDVNDRPDAIRKRIGIVFQSVALDAELTVRENFRTHAALYGVPRRALDERLGVLLPQFGLVDRLDDRVSTLSGGLKRRADLVRGLLHAPPLLLLDEPTTGLDPAARHSFWETVDRVRRSEGMTILLATHSMEEAERCDRLVILDRGSIVANGTPEELRRRVGDETLWIECSDPRTMANNMASTLNVDTVVVGSRVQVSDPNAHNVLPALYEAFGDDIHAATIRRPTLEDVFMLHAGRSLEDADSTPDR